MCIVNVLLLPFIKLVKLYIRMGVFSIEFMKLEVWVPV